MMKKKDLLRPHLIIISIFCLLLASCGYFSDEPVSGAEVYENGQMTTACNLNTDELELILEQDVEYQIKCLEAHFKDFIKFVRVENRQYVTEHELGTFIRRFFHGNSEHIIKSLKFLFELNMLLLNDNRDQISQDNISPLFRLMIEANKSAIIITKTLKDIDNTNYWDSREILSKSFENLAQSILGIIEIRDTRDLGLNLRTFLTDMRDRFENFDLSDNMISNGLFVKKLFLGGEKDILTSQETRELLVKAPKLIMAAVDFYFVDEKNFKNAEDLYGFYGHLLEQVEHLFHPLEKDSFLFNSNHLIDLADEMTDIELDKIKYEKLLNAFKTDILGGKKTQFSFGNLLASTNMIKGFLHGYRFYRYYKTVTEDLDEMNLQQRMDLNRNLNKKLTRILESLEPVMINNDNVPNKMAALDFTLTVKEIFEDKFEMDPELIKAFFSAKVLLLGGDKEALTKDEFSLLHSKVENLGGVGFDLIHIPLTLFDDDEKKYKFFRYNLEKLVVLLEDLEEYQRVFTIDEILTIADWSINKKNPPSDDLDEIEVSEEALDLMKFKPTLQKVKTRIFGGHPDIWTKKNFDTAVKFAQGALDKAYFFELTFRGQGDLMFSPEVITSLPMLYMPEYKEFSTEEVKFYTQSFLYHAKHFKYFRDQEGFSYYGIDIKRNAFGFTENALVRYALDIFLRSYGSKKAGVWALELDHLKVILQDFQPVLEELGLWTLNFENYVSNILLLSDLFQSMSNGTLRLELDEGTEFGNLVFQTMIMSHDFLDELKKIHDNGEDSAEGNDCSYSDPEDLQFDTLECHRKYFFEVFFNRLGYKKNYPRFYDFYKTAPEKELSNFISNVEGFARDFGDDTTIPMAARDYGLLIGAMINIESTFLRFDTNNDNLLDNKELDKAFIVYREAIIAVAKLDESKEKYAKSIFIYMVKYLKIPTTLQLLNFHFAPWANHDVLAKRVNIGALLYYLVKNK
jgi:hypothetical protein